MIRTTYVCDRCKQESNVKMIGFNCEFGRPKNHNHPLPHIHTGHLCKNCESDWCNTFFNQIVAWVKNKELQE